MTKDEPSSPEGLPFGGGCAQVFGGDEVAVGDAMEVAWVFE